MAHTHSTVLLFRVRCRWVSLHLFFFPPPLFSLLLLLPLLAYVFHQGPHFKTMLLSLRFSPLLRVVDLDEKRHRNPPDAWHRLILRLARPRAARQRLERRQQRQ